MSDDNFSKYPKSLAEHQADKARDGSKWTPRDALIAALRELDEGTFKPKYIAIVAEVPTSDGFSKIQQYRAVTGPFHLCGMLQAAIQETLA